MSEWIRFCQTVDTIAAVRTCKWPDGDIGISVLAVPRGVPEEQFRAGIQWCCEQINAACGTILYLEDTARLACILAGTRNIDGAGGVLAESEMPCGTVLYCRQWYDGGEHWDWTWPNFNRQKIALRLVLLHEIMHALGVPHAPERTVAVIAPFYNPDLAGLQDWDITELRRRYGPPRELPPNPLPPPAPEPPAGGGGYMGWLKILKILLPAARVIAARTETPVDDVIIDLLGRLLDLLPAAQTQADVAEILRQEAEKLTA